MRRGAGARREREVRETRARLQHEVKARLAAEAQAQVRQSPTNNIFVSNNNIIVKELAQLLYFDKTCRYLPR